jgi:fermentation-respiration switch protein FrsA (DUF1100 family)
MNEGDIAKKQVYTRVLNFLLTILVGYVVVLVLVRVFEARLIFFPDYPSRLEGDWHPRGLPVEDVWLTAADGVKLHAWWIPNEKAKFTLLALHGNASNIANRAAIYDVLHKAPGNVLALEYRGYGHSEGSPSEAGIYRDADAAYAYVVQTKGVDAKRVIAFGQSLGTAVATHVAMQHAVGGLILEAPFPSASRLARKVFWFLPGASLAVHGQFNTGEWIKSVRAPILIVHCEQDPVIPFAFGQEVYEAAPEPKTFVAVGQACHEEASLMAPERYRAALERFLKAIP